MRYDNGASCWGVTYPRNCEVVVQCGNENKVLKVEEPNKCEYRLQFTTPAACSPARLAALEKEYNQFAAEEFANQAAHFATQDII